MIYTWTTVYLDIANVLDIKAIVFITSDSICSALKI